MQERLDSRTDQEREVMRQIVDGSPNKFTARRLGIIVRTIENRRRSVFAKLEIRSVAEVVTLVMQSTTPESRRTMHEPLLHSAMIGSESLLCSAS